MLDPDDDMIHQMKVDLSTGAAFPDYLPADGSVVIETDIASPTFVVSDGKYKMPTKFQRAVTARAVPSGGFRFVKLGHFLSNFFKLFFWGLA